MADGVVLFAVTFERWEYSEQGVGVESEYCRVTWLPTIGPAAWVVWVSISRELEQRECVKCSAAELARLHGVTASELISALAELVRYGLALCPALGVWQVRSLCPRLWDRDLVLDSQLTAPSSEAGTSQPLGGIRAPQVWTSRRRPISSRGAR
jgi:hypothetical protein